MQEGEAVGRIRMEKQEGEIGAKRRSEDSGRRIRRDEAGGGSSEGEVGGKRRCEK